MRAGAILRPALVLLLLALVLRPAWFTPVFAPLAPRGRAGDLRPQLAPVAVAQPPGPRRGGDGGGDAGRGDAGDPRDAPAGAAFRPLSRTITNMGQTFPPVAVLALAVPALGFGAGPTLVALFLYGLLPIFENAVTALSTLPPATMEAARGIGLNRWQRLVRVELPLALPGDPDGHPAVGRDLPGHRDDRLHRRRPDAGRGDHRGAADQQHRLSCCRAG